MLRFESFGRFKPSFGFYWVLDPLTGWHVFGFAKAEAIFSIEAGMRPAERRAGSESRGGREK